MFQPDQLPRGPTEAEYALVKKVYEETAVLTVKDRVTGRWVKPKDRCGGGSAPTPYQDVIAYGATRGETPGSDPGGRPAGDASSETHLVRATYVLNVGSKRYPDGIAYGGYEVWRQDNFFVDTGKFSVTDFRFDAWWEERKMLQSWANELPYVTDAVWEKSVLENKQRREGRLATQEDPVGSLTSALAPALAQILGQAQNHGPPPELLAKAGFVQDAKTGEWSFRGQPVRA